MTVAATPRKAGPYTGDGVNAAFPFSFKVFAGTDVLVVQTDLAGVETTLTLTSQYTVSVNPDQDNTPGGVVTILSAPATGYLITIGSAMPLSQLTLLTNTGGFFPTVINDMVDRVTILVQQLSEKLSRTLSLPFSAPSGTSLILPLPQSNQLIGWNADGDGLQNLDPGTLATIVAFGTAQPDIFSGDGGTKNFNLTYNPGSLGNLDVAIGGVTQRPGIDYTWSGGTVLSFVSAPPAGTSNILARYIKALPQGYADSAAVTAVDGASGTLFTTVQGFITKILSSAGASLVGFIQSGVGAILRSLQSKNRDYLSLKDYGVVGNGIADDTAALQAALNEAMNSGRTLLGNVGVYNHTGLTINKPIKWIGDKIRGPVYGVQTNYIGCILQYTPTTGDAITFDATGLLNNQGLAVHIESVVFEGNKNVVGAVSGGGVNLKGDTTGEVHFVTGSIFKDVHVRNAKGDGWTITGTCFLNNWYACGSSYNGGHGLTHNKGAGGNPTNNNWMDSSLDDNGGFGFNCNGGKSTLTNCNLSQNTGGGFNQDGGYLILQNCDYESNVGPAGTVINSSGATRISGGTVHKTPAGAARVGFSFGAGCANITVDDVLFANYDNASDRVLAFSGGGVIDLFTYRFQNTPAAAFPTSLWSSIARLPQKDKIAVGTVTFAGAGVRDVTQAITFSTPFESAYTIIAVMDVSGITPDQVHIGIDYSTQSLSGISAKCHVSNAGYGAVSARYIATGR